MMHIQLKRAAPHHGLIGGSGGSGKRTRLQIGVPTDESGVTSAWLPTCLGVIAAVIACSAFVFFVYRRQQQQQQQQHRRRGGDREGVAYNKAEATTALMTNRHSTTVVKQQQQRIVKMGTDRSTCKIYTNLDGGGSGSEV